MMVEGTVSGARLPMWVWIASLIGYVALCMGDYAYGVFDVVPGQIVVLAVVVAVAVLLAGAGLFARRRGLLG